MKDFVATVDTVDDRSAVARIFQLGQFRDDEGNQGVVIRRLHDALWFNPSEVDPDAGRRSEHLAAVGFRPAPIDAREGRVSHFALLPDLWKEQGEPAFLS